MITKLFLYRTVAWCLIKRMKYLSILMVGVALLVGGCGEKEVADEKPAKEQKSVQDPIREVSADELEEIWHLKGKTEPFTGTAISYWENGSKKEETPYVNGKLHGTEIEYRSDGSKWGEFPWVDGIKHGTEIGYFKDGTKAAEIPYVNGKEHGTQIWYNEEGSIKAEIVYENGESTSPLLPPRVPPRVPPRLPLPPPRVPLFLRQ